MSTTSWFVFWWLSHRPGVVFKDCLAVLFSVEKVTRHKLVSSQQKCRVARDLSTTWPRWHRRKNGLDIADSYLRPRENFSPMPKLKLIYINYSLKFFHRVRSSNDKTMCVPCSVYSEVTNTWIITEGRRWNVRFWPECLTRPLLWIKSNNGVCLLTLNLKWQSWMKIVWWIVCLQYGDSMNQSVIWVLCNTPCVQLNCW